jgi:nitrate/nitrite-specific signal transduction histidine kinase/TRAP-type C4-dicarboxylate transport system permease small subunit
MLAVHALLVPVFLISGLAFFAIVLAIMLERRGDSDLPLTDALPTLALFALLQGLAQWMSMYSINSAAFAGPELRISVAILLAGSHLFLLWFGADLMSRFWQDEARARRVVLVPVIAWAACTALLAWGLGLPAGDWPLLADATSRYLLVLPGGFMAVWGLYRHRSAFEQLLMPRIGRDCIWAGGFLTLFVLANGLVTPELPFPPASVANYHQFHELTGLPVQLFRTVFVVGFALFVLRALRAYQEELHRELDAADRGRLLAQQEALEAQRQVDEQLRTWNETLERTVKERALQLVRRQLEAEALYQVGNEILSELKLDSILRSVAERSRLLIEADLASVALVDDDGERITLPASSGVRTEVFGRFTLRVGEGLVGRVVATGRDMIVEDYLASPDFRHVPEVDAAVAEEGLRAHLAVPMKHGNQVLGALAVACRGRRQFTESDRWLLDRLAVLTAIAIENSRLHEQAQMAAVLEERERLSREIHDGLAQSLGYIGMMVRAAQERLEAGRIKQVGADLEQIELVARDAYCDARESILGLRVSAYGGPGLVAGIREYVSRFRDQCGLDVRVEVDEGWPSALPQEYEMQLIRIVQEALSNVRKHAGARRVLVELLARDDRLEVAVHDDGRGFQLRCDLAGASAARGGTSRPRRDCFGMQSMSERARLIGAELDVRTAPGEGTRVAVRLPLECAVPSTATAG